MLIKLPHLGDGAITAPSRRRILAGLAALPALSGCAFGQYRDQKGPKRGLLAVTLGVADLRRAMALFHDTMGLTVESDGAVSSTRRRMWGLPDAVTATMSELSCAGYPVGRVRLLHVTPSPTTFVRTDFGPNAEDSPYAIGPKGMAFYAKNDVIAAADDFRKYGLEQRLAAPAVYPGGNYEFTFTGVGEAPTTALSRLKQPGLGMRDGLPTDRYSEIARVSVVCDDLQKTRRFYGDLIGLKYSIDEDVGEGFARPMRRIFNVPLELKLHRIVFTAEYEPSGKVVALQVSNQPKQRLRNAMGPQHRGICIYTFGVDDIAGAYARAQTLGIEVIAPPQFVDGAHVMVVRGPNGEFCELVE